MPGTAWTYDASGDLGSTVEVRVEEAPRDHVAGVECLVVRTSVVDPLGRGSSGVTRFYAQDRAGNVWLLRRATGADRHRAARHWMAGENGAQAGMAMLATPRVGDGYLQEQAPMRRTGRTVLALDEERTVPAGTFGGLLRHRRTTLSGDHHGASLLRRGSRPGVRRRHRHHQRWLVGAHPLVQEGRQGRHEHCGCLVTFRWGQFRQPPSSWADPRLAAVVVLRARLLVGAAWGGWAGLLRAVGPARRLALRVLPDCWYCWDGCGGHAPPALAAQPRRLLLVPLLRSSGAPYPGTAPGGVRRPRVSPDPATGSPWRPNSSGEGQTGQGAAQQRSEDDSHSWSIASPPAKSAGPMERAGFTDAPVSGIVVKWIIDNDKPIASGAECGMFVALVGHGEDHQQEDERSVTQLHEQGRPPGEPETTVVAEGVLADPPSELEARDARRSSNSDRAGADRPDELRADVRRHLRPREPATDRCSHRDRGVEVAARDAPDRVGHHQDGQAEARPGTTSAPVASAVPTPKNTSTKVPATSAANFGAGAGIRCRGSSPFFGHAVALPGY